MLTMLTFKCRPQTGKRIYREEPNGVIFDNSKNNFIRTMILRKGQKIRAFKPEILKKK